MKKIYTTDSLVAIQHLKNVLEIEGIPCMVKNDQLYTLRAEVPFVDVWPQLWVMHERDMGRAREILQRELQGPPKNLREWTCPSCGEVLEGQFTACWQCGASPEDKHG